MGWVNIELAVGLSKHYAQGYLLQLKFFKNYCVILVLLPYSYALYEPLPELRLFLVIPGSINIKGEYTWYTISAIFLYILTNQVIQVLFAKWC